MQGTLGTSAAAVSQSEALLLLEATMYSCLREAASAFLTCEQELLRAVLAELEASQDVRSQWRVAGRYAPMSTMRWLFVSLDT